MSTRPVLIVAGGTGGHIFPALAVAEVLRARDIPLLWLGGRYGMENRLVPGQGITLLRIAIRGLRGKGWLSLLLAPFRLSVALLQSLYWLLRIRPRVVLGLGGYVTGPAGVAAWLLRIPLLIHEQNTVAGMSNRLLAPLARRVMQAFPNTFRAGALTTGNPVRTAITQLPIPSERLQPSPERLSVLVLGGSLGARILNRTVPAALARLGAVKLAVLHQTGEAGLDETRSAYQAVGLSADVRVFIDDMASAYASADIVICRAGALTVSELAAAGCAAILVPYPHAVDDHQFYNAGFLVDADAAVRIRDADLNVATLTSVLLELSADPQRRLHMASQARALASPAAAQVIAEHCLEVANG